MDITYSKSFGSIIIISLLLFLFDLQAQAKTFEKPAVVRKKIHRNMETTKKTTAQRTPKDHLKKISLSPKSDISTSNIPVVKEPIHTAKSKSDDATRPLYNPVGKLDPFKPVIRAAPEKHSGPLEPVLDRPGRPTAIEKFELSQLKLTGIIIAKNGNKGLVREPAGKGHVVTIGTYIGTCGGKVVTILKDKVIVEEKWKDYAGNVGIQHKEIRFIKNTGKL